MDNINIKINDSFILINGIEGMEEFMNRNYTGKTLAKEIWSIKTPTLKNLSRYDWSLINSKIAFEIGYLEKELDILEKHEHFGYHSDKYYHIIQSIKYYAYIETKIEYLLDDF